MVPSFHGTYRHITAALSERLGRERGPMDFDEALASPVEILVPSRGIADAIVASLAGHFPQGLVGFRLQTPETLALRILNRAGRYPRVAAPEDRGLLMLLAAQGIRDPRLSTPGIPSLLDRSYRDIRDSGVPLASFRRKRDSFADPERAGELLDAWRRYESMLARSEAIDPADAFHQAIEAMDENVASQIVFGFYDMTGIQEMFLTALHGKGKLGSIYLPVDPEDQTLVFAKRFLDTIRKICGRWPGAGGQDVIAEEPAFPSSGSQQTKGFRDNALATGHRPLATSWTIRRHATPMDEAREVSRSVRALIDAGTDPRRIGIVTRSSDPERVTILRRAAADFDLNLSLPASRPLVSHPFGRTLRLLLEIREQRFPRAMVIELAGGPLRRDFWGFPFNAQRMDAATRSAEIAGGPSSWVKSSLPRIEAEDRYSLEHVTNYLKVLNHLEQFTDSFGTERRGGRWAATLEDIAEALYVDSEEDLAALASIRELAAVCRRADGSGASFGSAAVVRLLEDADALRLPPSGGPAVWAGDVMKARGRSFDQLFLMDFRDGAFPQGRTEDPLVPNVDRNLAGVRAIGDGRDEERLLFQLLVDSVTAGIHFSWAISDGVRRVFQASPFLKEFAQNSEPDPTLRRLAIRNFAEYVAATSPASDGPKSAVEKSAAALSRTPLSFSRGRRLDSVRLAGTRSRYDNYLTVSDKLRFTLEERLALISPSRLEAYGQCPQRFLLNAILGVMEIEDPEYELQISIRKKGGLDHRILESFYSSLTDADYASAVDGNVPDALIRRLEATIDEQFRRHEFDYPAPNQMVREVERKLTRRFLTEFVREDMRGLVNKGFRPAFFEYQFGPARDEQQPDHPAVPIALGDRLVTLRGKIDRVDRHLRDNAYRVLDYKSGRAVKFKGLSEQIESGRALQLAFYALAAQKIFDVPPENIHAAIRPMREGEWEDEKAFVLSEVLETLTGTLAHLGEAMTAGSFPAFPGKHCEYCAVGRWCRSRNDPREKQSLGQFNSAVEMFTSPDPRAPSPERDNALATDHRPPATNLKLVPEAEDK